MSAAVVDHERVRMLETCEPVCPAGVEYGALLEHWRDAEWKGSQRPWIAWALMRAVTSRWLLWLIGTLRRHSRTQRGAGPHLMLGCAERGLFPEVSRAARRLRPELLAPRRQGCCGALHAHNGELEKGRELARRLGEQLPGAIVTTSGGCAAHLAEILGTERVKELSQYLISANAQPPGQVTVDGRPARVTLQDSCHLRNGLGVWREPRELIGQVAEYVEMPDAAGCCGAAGTYSLLRSKDSRRVLDLASDGPSDRDR